jgi:hypothetical protein
MAMACAMPTRAALRFGAGEPAPCPPRPRRDARRLGAGDGLDLVASLRARARSALPVFDCTTIDSSTR